MSWMTDFTRASGAERNQEDSQILCTTDMTDNNLSAATDFLLSHPFPYPPDRDRDPELEPEPEPEPEPQHVETATTTETRTMTLTAAQPLCELDYPLIYF